MPTRKCLLCAGLLRIGSILSGDFTTEAFDAHLTPLDEPRQSLRSSFVSIPLHFEPNQGQAPSDIRFVARGPGYCLGLRAGEIALNLYGSSVSQEGGKNQASRSDQVQFKFQGANPAPLMKAGDLLPGRINHFFGSDPARWRTNIHTFGTIRYEQIYPGIDLICYGRQQELEYDFIVAPGANPELVRLKVEGASTLTLDASGDLLISLESGELRQRCPVIYQMVEGQRRAVSGGFVLHAPTELGFEIGAYNAAEPLVIDPVLVYSTYFGSSAGTFASDLAVDPTDNVYLVGNTGSTADFPFKNAYQDNTDPRIDEPHGHGGPNAFVAKFSSSGALVYATYLGGESFDTAAGIALDLANNAYVIGTTRSSPTHFDQFAGPLWSIEDGFPATPGAYSTNFFPDTFPNTKVAFVAKLNAAGGLVYSTFLTRERFIEQQGIAISVNLQGEAFVAFDESPGQVLGKLNATGSDFIFRQSQNYLRVGDLATDFQGNLYVVGTTAVAGESGWLMKLSPTGEKLYATSIPPLTTGTALNTVPTAVTADHSGKVYVTGYTRVIPGFPTKNAFQAGYGGGDNDGFVFVVDPDPSKPGTNGLVYASYLGGSGDDRPTAIAVDEIGRIYVAGYTTSTNFPLSNPLQNSFAVGKSGVFVSQFNAAGSGLSFSSYLGGSGNNSVTGLGVDLAARHIYVGGWTDSTNFPTAQPLQGSLASAGGSAFLSKIAFELPQATLTVNSTNDLDDGVCDTAHCSLREAINAANSMPGRQRITFDIPVNGFVIPSIRPASPLPLVREPVEIDGTSEPFVNRIELDGSNAGPTSSTDGLFILGGDSVIKGLVINRFSGNGIQIQGSGGNQVLGNFIGTDVTGKEARPNQRDGIYINTASSDNAIGNSTPGEGNLISGNHHYGIQIFGASSRSNKISGNLIGTELGGTNFLANEWGGIAIVEAANNQIGRSAKERNVISGNIGHGITISQGAIGNTIQGNIIGLTINGARKLGNQGHGIWVVDNSSATTIGGTEPGLGNIISGNTLSGIVLSDRVSGTRVQGNYIGTDLEGKLALGNEEHGVSIEAAPGNSLGGATPFPGFPPGNLISGNVLAGVRISGPDAPDNGVAGNLIGSDLSGRFAVPNQNGIVINAPGTIIGGPEADLRNLISGSLQSGILIEQGSEGTVIQGNFIGTDDAGAAPLANRTGISLEKASHVQIGGAANPLEKSLGNLISGNTSDGIALLASQDNVIQGNMVGVSPAGLRLPNKGYGISILNSSKNVIGSDEVGGGNVISGNGDGGIIIDEVPVDGFYSDNNRILGNKIGLTDDGLPLGNGGPGIWVANGAGNSVGDFGNPFGRALTSANIIAYNHSGVVITAESRPGTPIVGNSIYKNDSLPIDLGNDGPTPNDPGDLDAGPNTLQNYPVLWFSYEFGLFYLSGFTEVNETGLSLGLSVYVELFSGTSCELAGKDRFSSFAVTPMGGKAFFKRPVTLPLGAWVAATATAAGRSIDTSEFSPCLLFGIPPDSDGDKVSDSTEMNGPNGGDGNKDGIPDFLQPEVQSILLPNRSSIGWQLPGNSLTWWKSKGNYSVDNIQTTTEPPGGSPPPPNLTFGSGLHELRLKTPMPAPGPQKAAAGNSEEVTLVLFIPVTNQINAYYLFGPTPDNRAPHWYDFSFDGSTGAILQNDRIELHFRDGQRGDHDLATNGIITTLGGPAWQGLVPFQIVNFGHLPGNQFFLSVSGDAAHAYTVQSSSDLVQWISLSTNQTVTGSFDFIDIAPDVPAHRFYRVQQR